MATVRIPPVLNGNGELIPATVEVRLVGAKGYPVLAFNSADLTTEVSAQPIPEEGLELPLAPTALLARPDGTPTWYRVLISFANFTELYLIQVANLDDAVVQELADLAVPVPIDPPDILAGRLVPSAQDLPDGWSLLTLNGAPVWAETADPAAVSEDPADPPEGHSVSWMSDGTASGDAGDILMKITMGGVTKTVTLVDFSVA